MVNLCKMLKRRGGYERGCQQAVVALYPLGSSSARVRDQTLREGAVADEDVDTQLRVEWLFRLLVFNELDAGEKPEARARRPRWGAEADL